MVDLKFKFPHLLPPALKKKLPVQNEDSISVKGEERRDDDKKSQDKEIPLFYSHKIRAASFEFF
jgi:hypothetical protein